MSKAFLTAFFLLLSAAPRIFMLAFPVTSLSCLPLATAIPKGADKDLKNPTDVFRSCPMLENYLRN